MAVLNPLCSAAAPTAGQVRPALATGSWFITTREFERTAYFSNLNLGDQPMLGAPAISSQSRRRLNNYSRRLPVRYF